MAAPAAAKPLHEICDEAFCKNVEGLNSFNAMVERIVNRFHLSPSDNNDILVKQMIMDGAGGIVFFHIPGHEVKCRKKYKFNIASANGEYLVYENNQGKPLFIKIRNPCELDDHLLANRPNAPSYTDPIEIDSVNQRFLTFLLSKSPELVDLFPLYKCSFKLLVHKEKDTYFLDPSFTFYDTKFSYIDDRIMYPKPIFKLDSWTRQNEQKLLSKDVLSKFSIVPALVTEGIVPFYTLGKMMFDIIDCALNNNLEAWNNIKQNLLANSTNVTPTIDILCFLLKEAIAKPLSDFWTKLIILGKLGFSHNDMHDFNICLQNKNSKPVITMFDFGRAKFSKQFLSGEYQNHLLEIIEHEVIKLSYANIYMKIKKSVPALQPLYDMVHVRQTRNETMIDEVYYYVYKGGCGLPVAILEKLTDPSNNPCSWASVMYDIVTLVVSLHSRLRTLYKGQNPNYEYPGWFFIEDDDNWYIPDDIIILKRLADEANATFVENAGNTPEVVLEYMNKSMHYGYGWFVTMLYTFSLTRMTQVQRLSKVIQKNSVVCRVIPKHDIFSKILHAAGNQVNTDLFIFDPKFAQDHLKHFSGAFPAFCQHMVSYYSSLKFGGRSKRGGTTSINAFSTEPDIRLSTSPGLEHTESFEQTNMTVQLNPENKVLYNDFNNPPDQFNIWQKTL